MTYGSSTYGSTPYGGALNSTVKEIKEKAKKFCQQSKGTPTEELACEISKEVQTWHVGDQLLMTKNVENIVKIFRLKIPLIPENMGIYNEIEKIGKERDVTKQYEILAILITLVPTQIHIGDNISDIKNYGKDSQQIIKSGNNINKNIIVDNKTPKKSWTEKINISATISSFVLAILIEIWNIFFSNYPILYGHIISATIVISMFLFIIWQINSERK